MGSLAQKIDLIAVDAASHSQIHHPVGCGISRVTGCGFKAELDGLVQRGDGSDAGRVPALGEEREASALVVAIERFRRVHAASSCAVQPLPLFLHPPEQQVAGPP